MRTIIVKQMFDGTHCWPEAPEHVSFLRNMHRHVFHVAAEIEVYHNDRELEFFTVQRWLRNLITAYVNKANLGSCEMLAELIMDKLDMACHKQTDKKKRRIAVTVSEDGENAARVSNREDW